MLYKHCCRECGTLCCRGTVAGSVGHYAVMGTVAGRVGHYGVGILLQGVWDTMLYRVLLQEE